LNPKLSFPTGTADLIERHWWGEISKEFPTYGTFWEDLIGLKDPSKPFEPYGLIIPALTCSPCAEGVRLAYLELSEAHYSEFCELAGAHYQITEAERSYNLANPEATFLFLEAFNAFYDHLGTARNMALRLWTLSRAIAKGVDPASPLAKFKSDSSLGLIESRLRANGQGGLVPRLKLIEDQVVNQRNHHIHDYGARFGIVRKRFHFVLPKEESVDLSQIYGWTITEEECGVRMRRHLETLERFLDGSERVLLADLSGALSAGGVVVNY
jgi:hypothetical protein